MNAAPQTSPIETASQEAALLGESPLWHPLEQCLYYVDIARQQVLRLGSSGQVAQRWQLGAEPGCIAAAEGGGLLVAQRDGLWRLDTQTGQHRRLSAPPYDPARQRFNDGKPDARGRLWVGTIDDARLPEASLYCHQSGDFRVVLEGITTSNGLAWSPDQRTLYVADTKAHAIYAMPFDLETGAVGEWRVLASFAPRQDGQGLDSYGGRPDGAAVDVDGCYWVAMYEGQRLLRLSPEGRLLNEIALPVRCPTMPCFGDADLRTLYITTASDKRPADELAAQPWAGRVLKLRVEVPGLPASLAKI